MPTSVSVELANMAKSSNKVSEPVAESHVSEGPKKPIQANMEKSSAKVSELVTKSHVSEGPKKTIQANETIEEHHHVQVWKCCLISAMSHNLANTLRAEPIQ